MTRRGDLLDALYGRFATADEIMGLYIDDPSEKNIHDLRTSIRRLESAYSIIPKSSRSGSSAKALKRLKKLFSMNSGVRDCDIMLEKLAGYGAGPEHLSALQRRRAKRLSLAVKFAKKIRRPGTPKLGSGSRMVSKCKRVTLLLVSDVMECMPVVTGDESRVDDLHSMRKKIKRLRYILEISGGKRHAGLLLRLKDLQTILGDIHDCDIFISYLERRKGAYFEDMLRQEKMKRHYNYQCMASLKPSDV